MELLGEAGTGNRVVSQAEYARHRGVSKQAINALVRKGRLAEPAVTADGQIDVALADAMLDAPTERGTSLASENAKLQKAKRELAELELQERRRELLPAAVLRASGADLAALLRARLLARRSAVLEAVQAAPDPDRAMGAMDDALCHEIAAEVERALAP